MSPPTERRPDQQTGATNEKTSGGKSLVESEPHAADDAMPTIERRAGDLIRVTRSRAVVCVCLDCDRRFNGTAAAASHSRSARHKVEVDYRTAFVFAPCELLDGVR